MKKITFILSLLLAFSTIGYSQVSGYTFSQSNVTYTPITGGTVLGNTTTDDQRFVDPATPLGGTVNTGVGFPIGFDFTYNGLVYDRFAVNANGWISLGVSTLTPSVDINTTSAYTPLSSTVTTVTNELVARIAGYARDLNAQTGAELRFETIGSAPNRKLVVQWSNYRNYNATGNNLNFQIVLNETTNSVDVIYGTMTVATSTTTMVGLRAEPNNNATNFNSRTSTTSWSSSAASTNAGNTMTISATIFPASGLQYSWSPPSCPAPTNVVVSNITTNSADFSWTAGGSEFDWEYLILPAGSPAPTGSGNDIDTDSFTEPGLNSGTAYAFWIRAYCSFSDQSNWVGPFNFNTLCVPYTVPYFEGFETSYIHNTAVGLCLSQASVTGAAVWTANNTLTDYNRAPRTGAWNAFLQWSNEDWLFIPIQLVGGTSYTVEAYARQDGATAANSNIAISYGTANNAAAMTNVITPATGIVNGAYQLITGAFTPASDGVYYIGIKGFMNGTPWYISLDDISVFESPTLPPTCATNVVATPNASCGNFATAITWDSVIGSLGYNITMGTTPGGNDILNNVDLGAVVSYNFTGTVNTTYYYTIVPYNANGSATGCVEQSFTTNANGCYCVPTYTNGGATDNITNVAIGSWSNASTGNVAPYYEDFTSQQPTPIAIPDLTAGLSTTVSVTMGSDGTQFSRVWIDFNQDLIFDPSESFSLGTSAGASGTSNIVVNVPAGATLGITRMRIRGGDDSAILNTQACGASSSTWGQAEDYLVNIIAAPPCLPPSALNVTAVTAATASLGWTENGTATSWDVEWGTLGFTPTGTPTVSGASNPEAISGLSPNTAYSFYVRANCGGDGFSTWSGPFNFTTSCVADDVPYSQNFESATVPNLPACTSQQNVGTGNLWTVVNNPGYGFTTNALRYSWNSSSAANVWFFTNGVNLVGGTTYRISYDYGSASSFYVERLRVSYGSSASAAGMTDLLAEHPNVVNNVTPINNVVEFTPGTSGVYYFGFNAYSIADQFNLYVDNILVEVALSSNTFDNNNFMVYPNPVKDVLNLSYTSEISTVRVMNMLGQEVISRKLNSANAQVDMSQLSAGTYIVNVTIGDTVKTIKVVKQ